MENKSLNLLKALACLTVILLHCPFPGVLGDGIIYGMRFSVPIFFMITGYYSYGKGESWMKRRMKKTVVLLFGAELLSAAVRFFLVLGGNWNEIIGWIRQQEAFQKPVKALLFGSFFNGTLWYLYALFWTLAILYLFDKYIPYQNILYKITPFLLAGHILGWILVETYGEIDSYAHIFYSAVLTGVPFVTAGRFVSEYETQIAKYLKDKNCILLFIIGLGMQILEFLIWRRYMDLHMSTIVITFSLFWWACSHPKQDYVPWLRMMGKKYSMWIYVIHFPCILCINHMETTYISGGLQPLFSWIKPGIVISLSIVLAVAVERVGETKMLKKWRGK